MRWDLLDKFELLQRSVRSRAVKSLTGREDLFAEHYPGKPVLPEPLLIEMVAQAGGVLFGLGLDFKKEVILAKINAAEFPREITPPCTLTIDARLEDEREEGAQIEGTVTTASGDIAARVELMLVSMDSLQGVPGGQVVFPKSFLEHYDVFNIAKLSEAVR